jgi:glycosyltransferase involved in cell wall biosynthesis
LGATVELMGPLPQEQVAELLPAVDCYVQPSIITPSGKMEGIPVALMEALACELPVIATQISGIRVGTAWRPILVPQQCGGAGRRHSICA